MVKNKPTILVITGGYFPGVDFGGIATSRFNFSQALGDDYDIRIVTRNHDYKTNIPYDNIKDDWNEYGKGKVLYLPDNEFCEERFSKIIEQTKPIVVYLSGTITSYFYFNKGAIRAAEKLGVPVLLTPDGDVLKSAMHTKPLKKFVATFICRLTGAFKNVWFQPTSCGEVENLPKYLGIKKERITLLANLPCMFSARENHTKQKDSLRIVFAARIHPIKNLKFALEVVSKLKQNVTFDIYGSLENNEYWQECESVIATLGSNIKVTYKGRLDADKARVVAKEYDCFVLPTLSENYGYSIEEALLCGCPVVISRGTTPWDDVHGVAGFAGDLSNPESFVEELEKIAKMDENEYKNYTANIDNYIKKKLSYEKLVSDYKELIEKVAATKK